jgi:hypothetical protein
MSDYFYALSLGLRTDGVGPEKRMGTIVLKMFDYIFLKFLKYKATNITTQLNITDTCVTKTAYQSVAHL